jgi:hypothetical protein
VEAGLCWSCRVVRMRISIGVTVSSESGFLEVRGRASRNLWGLGVRRNLAVHYSWGEIYVTRVALLLTTCRFLHQQGPWFL